MRRGASLLRVVIEGKHGGKENKWKTKADDAAFHGG